MVNQHRIFSKTIDAIKVINKSDAYIALVVDDEEKLIGTITDGDIRRGLLKGENIDSKVSEIMNKKFSSVSENDLSNKKIEEIFKKGITQIPLLDGEGRVKELLQKEDIFVRCKTNINDVVIMAGGKGMRLRPQTENCPKPMIQINGKPMLEIILEKCIHFGFKKFLLFSKLSKRSNNRLFWGWKKMGNQN